MTDIKYTQLDWDQCKSFAEKQLGARLTAKIISDYVQKSTEFVHLDGFDVGADECLDRCTVWWTKRVFPIILLVIAVILAGTAIALDMFGDKSGTAAMWMLGTSLGCIAALAIGLSAYGATRFDYPGKTILVIGRAWKKLLPKLHEEFLVDRFTRILQVSTRTDEVVRHAITSESISDNVASTKMIETAFIERGKAQATLVKDAEKRQHKADKKIHRAQLGKISELSKALGLKIDWRKFF